MQTKLYRAKESPCTLTTTLIFEHSKIYATRVELVALDGTIIGAVYMYSDDDQCYSLDLNDIQQ